jgi:hypothetical protein
VIRRLVYVAFFLEVGLLLLVLPWSPFWDGNYFALMLPRIRPLFANNFLRGAVSGLGLVNLCAGVADLSHIFSSRGPRDVSGRSAA